MPCNRVAKWRNLKSDNLVRSAQFIALLVKKMTAVVTTNLLIIRRRDHAMHGRPLAQIAILKHCGHQVGEEIGGAGEGGQT